MVSALPLSGKVHPFSQLDPTVIYIYTHETRSAWLDLPSVIFILIFYLIYFYLFFILFPCGTTRPRPSENRLHKPIKGKFASNMTSGIGVQP